MSRRWCLDSSVLVKLIVNEPGSDRAAALLAAGTEFVAPAFAWAEVGSTLRKKVRAGQLTWDAAQRAWRDLLDLEVAFIQTADTIRRAWELADEFDLPTLYDAAFLAVAEKDPEGPCPFWTADEELLRRLAGRLPYVNSLWEVTA